MGRRVKRDRPLTRPGPAGRRLGWRLRTRTAGSPAAPAEARPLPAACGAVRSQDLRRLREGLYGRPPNAVGVRLQAGAPRPLHQVRRHQGQLLGAVGDRRMERRCGGHHEPQRGAASEKTERPDPASHLGSQRCPGGTAEKRRACLVLQGGGQGLLVRHRSGQVHGTGRDAAGQGTTRVLERLQVMAFP